MNYCELVKRFLHIYGGDTEGIRIFEAPGRINLIGEHIDYNGGHVFPAALELKNIVIARPNSTDLINMAVTSLPNRVIADIDSLADYKKLEWGNYQLGVAYTLKNAGYNIVGCDLLYHGNVPYGAGLSSSASIEVASALVFLHLGNNDMPGMEDVAVMCQKAENEYVGMNCGIMDQFISAVGKKDHAIFLNTRTLEYEYVPLELGDYTIVITNTNSPHKLTDSKYNERRAQCEQALSIINSNGGEFKYLCQLNIAQLEEYSKFFESEVLYKRARHCVSEEARTREAVKALKSGELRVFGKLLSQANISMRDDYEATGIELDALFNIVSGIDGVIGSRMTGAGFGGCNISIVEQSKVERFKKIVNQEYTRIIGYAPSFYQSKAGQGVMEVAQWR
jgi:galactokinase